jgi:hypothetical protein
MRPLGNMVDLNPGLGSSSAQQQKPGQLLFWPVSEPQVKHVTISDAPDIRPFHIRIQSGYQFWLFEYPSGRILDIENGLISTSVIF